MKIVRGALADVASYATLELVLLEAGDSFVADETPAVGGGWYYLVAPRDCGSWQTQLGDTPARDLHLP